MAPREHGQFVELEFAFADDAHPAVRISQHFGCELELLDAVQSGEVTTFFFRVTGGCPDAMLEVGCAAEYEAEIDVVERYGDECLLRLSLTRSLFRTLAEAEVPLQSLVVRDGRARFVATVPPDRVPGEIISLVNARHPSASLVRKRRTRIAAPFVTRRAFQTILTDRLTERQWDALALAFEYGYFERPRRTTQQALATEMDISPSTFGQHLHAALRKLLATLFTDDAAPDSRLG